MNKITLKSFLLSPFSFLLLVMLMTGCVDADDFRIRSLDITSVRLPSSAVLEVGLESRSNHPLHLLECALDVEYQGDRALALVLAEPVVVPKKFIGKVDIPLRMRAVDPLVALSVMGDLDRALEQATVSGEALIRAGGIRKRIRLNHYPLTRFIDTFTPSGK